MAELTSVDDLTDQPHAEVFAEHRPRTVRLSLDAGDEVPGHHHPDHDIVLYGMEGTIELRLDDETYEVTPGDAVQFSGEREISPRAVEDARALVVFAPAE
ncbi:cupin domain-containing protein [Halostella litorea]|uniref:cupin domain-containing protein n=1 Tax=Halostella litorea TaxID=2528831 RepID=UPI0010925424|nr:cupin domain-containing protein [Halostella litorea]